jgi:hypothetical protein
LDPTDPHGALLHLDYLAIKAGMVQWLLDVWDHFDSKWMGSKAVSGRANVTALPGWAYARALAIRTREDEVRCSFFWHFVLRLKFIGVVFRIIREVRRL